MLSSGNLLGLHNFMRPFIWLKIQGVHEMASEGVASELHENGLK